MNKQKWMMLTTTLGLMAVAAGLLATLRAHQRLGPPAVKTSEIPGSIRLQVDLPETVLDYTSRILPLDELTTNTLPPDTSFGQRIYAATNHLPILLDVVLMGSDRTSIHKTEFCLEGQGWRIDRQASRETTVRIERPHPYDLPVTEYIANRAPTPEQPQALRAVYVCWYVADRDELTPNYNQRMWWLARDLLRTGVLQRWSMVAYFCQCLPGQEDAVFEQMKKFIAASVPEFQLVPCSDGAILAARP